MSVGRRTSGWFAPCAARVRAARVLFTLALLWPWACATTAPGSGRVLTVASDLDNPPFAALDANGMPVGRDVEMMNALARSLGAELRWRRLPFEQLLPAVEAGEVDVVCATLGVTPERERSVAMTRPYFQTAIAVVVRAGADEPRTLAQLAGQRVGAAGGTTSERAVRAKLPTAIGVFENKDGRSTGERLADGTLAAAVLDGPAADALVAGSAGRFVRLDESLGAERYALALPPGSTELRDELDQALFACERSGQLAALDASFGLASNPVAGGAAGARVPWGAQADGDADERDPMQGLSEGMDPDGRIPKVALPPDVTNPDRWRYYPEGRILEGNVLERLLVSTFAVPLVFFKGDVGAGGGLSMTDIDFRTQRRREFATTTLTYTTEGQQNYAFLWRRWLNNRDLEGGGVIQEERSFVRLFVGYTKTLSRRFFGFGSETDEDDESDYAEEVAAISLGIQRSFPEPGDNWVVSSNVRVEKRSLFRGFLDDVPDTKDSFGGVFDDGNGLASLELSGGLRYDTHDSQANPYQGWSVGTWFDAIPLMTGGRGGIRYGLNGTWVVPLPPAFHRGGDAFEENPPTDRLAFAAAVTDTGGELPFWARTRLGGGHTLRGYIQNRFTDDSSWFAAAEYRFAVLARGFRVSEKVRVERVGLAVFYEVGSVASRVSALDTAERHDSVGLGLRIGLERAANFRLDLGFSDEGTNFTAVYGLSF